MASNPSPAAPLSTTNVNTSEIPLQKKASDVKAINDEEENGLAAPGEATLLVSEFPPPPYYFRQAAFGGLSPPPIPMEALSRGTRRAAAVAARAREFERRQRLQAEEQPSNNDTTDAILGGMVPEEEDEEGDVVAVFGEIVEDPLQVEPLDHCEDPAVVRDEIQRLHQLALRTFVRLVQDLVHRPLENKKTRDELSHVIFLMLQECNKLREYQAREILIEMLETQLAERRKLVEEFRQVCVKAAALME